MYEHTISLSFFFFSNVYVLTLLRLEIRGRLSLMALQSTLLIYPFAESRKFLLCQQLHHTHCFLSDLKPKPNQVCHDVY